MPSRQRPARELQHIRLLGLLWQNSEKIAAHSASAIYTRCVDESPKRSRNSCVSCELFFILLRLDVNAEPARYIRDHTSVSVPTVWAYGKDARVMTDPSATQPYLLCDYIPGQSLTFKQVSDATSEQRVEIFSDLINIYAQFFNLRFPVAGSLLPGTQKHASPRFGGLLSMSRNELQLVAGIEPSKPQIIYSAESYL